MKLLMILISCLLFINPGNGYFFPICSSDDKACNNYFSFPSFNIPLVFYSKESDNRGTEVSESPVHSVTNPVVETVRIFWSPVATFYSEILNPVNFLYEYVADSLGFASESFPLTKILKHIPILKNYYEEKAKADSRFYFLFIFVTFGIYLALYVYFTKKLYHYYQGSLREQYLDNVKKIFKGKR